MITYTVNIDYGDKVNERMYCAGNYCIICGSRLKDELIIPPKKEATP